MLTSINAYSLQGYRRTLQYDDIFDIPDALYTNKVYPTYEARFRHHIAAEEARGPKVKPFCLKFEQASCAVSSYKNRSSIRQ